MSPTKLDFLNRAHLQKKVQPGNETARLELAARLKVLLLEKFPGRCVVFAAFSSERRLMRARSESPGLDYIGRVVAALKVSTRESLQRIIADLPTVGTRAHDQRRPSSRCLLLLRARSRQQGRRAALQERLTRRLPYALFLLPYDKSDAANRIRSRGRLSCD